MRTVTRSHVGALAVAVAGAGLVVALASGTLNAQPVARETETAESRLAAAGLRVEDAPIEIPEPTTVACGMAILDYAAGTSGPTTPLEAVIERTIGSPTGTEPRSGVLAPVTESAKAATWVFVPDDGTPAITYHVSAAPGGGWIVGSVGIGC